MNPTDMVREFHEATGSPVGDRPKMVDDHRTQLRIELIKEEVSEVLEAVNNNDLENLAKELADLLYVTYGWAVEAGINLDAVFEEVHRSNMSKLGPDGKAIYRDDGKVLKGPNYFEANVAAVLG